MVVCNHSLKELEVFGAEDAELQAHLWATKLTLHIRWKTLEGDHQGFHGQLRNLCLELSSEDSARDRQEPQRGELQRPDQRHSELQQHVSVCAGKLLDSLLPSPCPFTKIRTNGVDHDMFSAIVHITMQLGVSDLGDRRFHRLREGRLR